MAFFHYRAHLGIAKEIKDTAGEACALLNLGKIRHLKRFSFEVYKNGLRGHKTT